MYRSLTDSEASPDRPATSLASGAITARQKGHVKSASTSHTLPLDLPCSSAAATTAGATTIDDLIQYVVIGFDGAGHSLHMMPASPHHLHVMHRCSTSLPMSHMVLSVCLSVRVLTTAVRKKHLTDQDAI